MFCCYPQTLQQNVESLNNATNNHQISIGREQIAKTACLGEKIKCVIGSFLFSHNLCSCMHVFV